MALTDGMLGLLAAGVLVYFTLLTSKTRWKRIVGSAAFLVLGVGFGLVADTAIMYIPGAICMLIGGIQLLQEAAAMVN